MQLCKTIVSQTVCIFADHVIAYASRELYPICLFASTQKDEVTKSTHHFYEVIEDHDPGRVFLIYILKSSKLVYLTRICSIN